MPNVVVASLVEFFTLKEAARQAARLDDAGRKRVLERAGLAKQRADAAESLWAAGHPAEALRLLVDAFGTTREASEAWLDATGTAPIEPTKAEPAAVSEPATASESASEPATVSESATASAPVSESATDSESATASESATDSESATASESAMDSEAAAASEPAAAPASEVPFASEPQPAASTAVVATVDGSSLARFLAQRSASGASLERLASLEKDLAATTLPQLDADVQPTHGDLFDRLTDTRTQVARALADVTLLPRELTFRRAGRITTVVALSAIAIVGSYLATRTPEGVHARASAHFNELPDFEPGRVLDGNTETSWLLPDRTAGWVEVTINPSRTVSRIRVLNTHNVPYNDRASLQYRIQVFAHGSEARVIDGAFEFSASPAWVTHDLGSIEGVDRVRFEVRSWHQHGGGLAEIAIE
ncbi:MAG: hypothetical protein J0L92_15815 [Deltaproteobacteria bacterium]|nr:hypothetical protein [Deltaproteobacteria bacterium]